jgi:hypothetical protein
MDKLNRYRADGHTIASYLLDKAYLRFMLSRAGIQAQEIHKGDGDRYSPSVYAIVDGIEIGLYGQRVIGTWRCSVCRATCRSAVQTADDLDRIRALRSALCECKE